MSGLDWKVGDRVVKVDRERGGQDRLLHVTHVWPIHIQLCDGTRWTFTGQPYPRSPFKVSIRRATAEESAADS